jgi:signal peptidase
VSPHRADSADRDTAARGVLEVLRWAVAALVLGLVLALVVVPRALGGSALTVLSGSMEPRLSPGDVVALRGVDDPAATTQVGDVITFQPTSDDPTLITHRVVAKKFATDGTWFVTRGDANGADDDPIQAVQIKGVVMYSVPWIGYATLWAGNRTGLLAAVGGVALFAYGAFMVLRPERRRSAVAADGGAAG